jgi:hypothetical protein
VTDLFLKKIKGYEKAKEFKASLENRGYTFWIDYDTKERMCLVYYSHWDKKKNKEVK